MTYFDTEQVSIENQTVSVRTDYLQEIQRLSINTSNSLTSEDHLSFTLAINWKSTLEIDSLSFSMSDTHECFNEKNGVDYRGTISKTREGTSCLNWESVSEEVTQNNGVGDHNYCRNPDDSPGGPWCYIESTPNKGYCDIDFCIKDALLYLFTAQCTGNELRELSDVLLDDFEKIEKLNDNYISSYDQASITLTEPYCGRNSFVFHVTDTLVYQFIDKKGYPIITEPTYICMAYKIPKGAPFVISLEIREQENSFSWFSFFSSTSSSEIVSINNVLVNLKENIVDDSDWHYGCFDIYDSLKSSENPLSLEILHYVRTLEIQTIKGTPLYIDVLTFSVEDRSVTQLYPAVHPNGITVSDLSVEMERVSDNSSNLTMFYFTFTTTDCLSGIPLIEANTNDSIVVETEQIQSASEPIRGNFSIKIFSSQNYSLDHIPHDINDREFLSIIEEEFKVGNAKGGIAYSEDICRERRFWISFYNLPGDLELVTVDSSNLSGYNVSVVVDEVTPGGLIIAPIPGHMLRTVNRVPQVVVKKNGVRAICKGPFTQKEHNSLLKTNLNFCDYSHSNASEPSITSISLDSVCVDSVLTIIGTSFGYIRSDLSIMIGYSQCNITSISDVNITCTLPHSVGGLQTVFLTKLSYGNSPATFNFSVEVCFNLLSISNIIGSIGGGLLLTIEASNGFVQFPTEDSKYSMEIEMANSTCEIVRSNHTHVQCLTPPSNPQVVDITVSLFEDGVIIANDTLGQLFTFSLAKSPNVTAISKSSGSILGGDIVTLYITAFPSVNPQVLFSGENVEVLHSNYTSITITTPAHSPSRVKVDVIFENIGKAISDMYYEFEFYVCSISHTTGSLFGGQSLSINGMGFSTGMDITIGTNKCYIESISNTRVICTTPTTQSSYSIQRRVFLPYTIEQWTPSSLQIYPGDQLFWSWSNTIPNEYVRVFLTTSPSAISPEITDNQSERSTSATYQYSFSTPGNYFYVAGTGVISNETHPADCYNEGEPYNGRLSLTDNFIPCLSWTAQYVKDNFEFDDPLLGDHNYCRNPDDDSNGPWCFASNTNQRAYCNVQKCGIRGHIIVNDLLPTINTSINFELNSFKPHIFASCQEVDITSSQMQSQLNYSYLPSSTPQVTAVIAEDIILPGSIIQLVGIYLATYIDDGYLLQIGNNNCSSVSKYNENTLNCTIPQLTSGGYRISLYVNSLGWAFFWNDLDKITISSAIIDSRSLYYGSVLGGSLLTLSAENFHYSYNSNYSLLIGNTPCILQEVILDPIYSQSITCLTQAPIDDGYSKLIDSLNPISYFTFDNPSDLGSDKGYLKELNSEIEVSEQSVDESHMNVLNQLHHSLIFNSNLIETACHSAYANFDSFGIEVWIRLSSAKLDTVIQQHSDQNVTTATNGYRVILENTPYMGFSGGYKLILNPCNVLEVWIAAGNNGTEADSDQCLFTPQLNCSLACSGTRLVSSQQDNVNYSSWYIISGPELNTSSLNWTQIAFGWNILGSTSNHIITDPNNIESMSQCVYERSQRKYCHGQANLIVNGVEYGRENVTYSPGSPVNKLSIGGTNKPLSPELESFMGILDEVVVYTFPLSQNEALLHYTASTRKQQLITVSSAFIDYVGIGITPQVEYPNIFDNYNNTGRAFKPTPNQHFIDWKIQPFNTFTIYSEDKVTFHWKQIASLVEVNKEYFDTCDESISPLKYLSSSAVQNIVNLTLETGNHYFTSQFEDHCKLDMKILITVLPTPPLKSLVTMKLLPSEISHWYSYHLPELIITSISIHPFVGAVLSINLASTISNDDNFTVLIGQLSIDDISIVNDTITCIIPDLEAGTYDLFLKQNNIGYIPFNSSEGLIENSAIQIVPKVLSSYPNSGSLMGGTVLTILGTGFSNSEKSVSLSGLECKVLFSNLTTIMCQTLGTMQSNEVNISITFSVQVNGITSQGDTEFDFLVTSTPIIYSISSSTRSLLSVQNGSLLILTGTMLTEESSIRILSQTNTNAPTCYSYGADCPISSFSSGNLTCIVPVLAGGMYTIVVFVPGYGYALENSSIAFNVIHSINYVNPTKVGTTGGAVITIIGNGFIGTGVSNTQCNKEDESPYDQNQVTVCSSECVITNSTASTIYCILPSSLNNTLHLCNVTVISNLAISHLIDAIEYDPTITPKINTFTPTTGGTGGGTIIAIYGAGFKNTRDSFQFVLVGKTGCTVLSWNDSTITCRTSPHSTNIEAMLSVFVTDVGFAIPSSQTYAYIDRWSSNFTWGGESPPREGETVYIPKQFIVLLDISPPPLNLILVEGKLIFEDTCDISLQAKYIVINGGYLQIGTEDEPFLHEATITLYGNILDPEIPLYGAKVLAVRQGGLDFHGIPVIRTWTRLNETARMGQDYLKLLEPVDWRIGDDIVIAPTGKDSNETEVRTVAEITDNGYVIKLNKLLDYSHLGIRDTYSDGQFIELRAEVGLLTHNIKIQGSQLSPSDPRGIESDLYGGHFMVFRPKRDSIDVRISNVEFRFMGQAFRLGRYSVHFHLSDRMNGSYVRQCSIHHSFNRAITAHGVEEMLFEGVVAFDIQGHAFFVEDGIEIGNRYINNFGVLIRGSSSLLNTDSIPAVFWITNPNNTFEGNSAVASRAYGFWYDLDSHPSGPSQTDSVCPNKNSFGEFSNNVAHSNAEFGLRIWETSDPHIEPCNSASDRDTITLFNLTSYSNGIHGVEFSVIGNIQVDGFKLADNRDNGIEISETVGDCFQAEIKNTLIISRTIGNSQSPQTGGIKTMRKDYLRISNVTFVNFNEDSTVCLRACSHCKSFQGGYIVELQGIKFLGNSHLRKAGFQWEHEVIYIDLDGTFTGSKPGSFVTPRSGILPSDLCNFTYSEFNINSVIPGAVCSPEVHMIRLAWNRVEPDITFKDKGANITNWFGSTIVPWRKKRLTHSNGYMVLLPTNHSYTLSYDIGDDTKTDVTSYDASISHMYAGDFVTISQMFFIQPDHFNMRDDTNNVNNRNATTSNMKPTADDNHLDWYFDNITNSLTYLLKGESDTHYCSSRSFSLTSEPCPVDEYDEAHCVIVNPIEGQYEKDPRTWSNPNDWPTGSIPALGEDVVINSTWRMHLDISPPHLGNVYVYGELTFDDNKDLNFTANIILIQGPNAHLIIGTSQSYFKHKAVITLNGNRLSEEIILSRYMKLGSKALGIFGNASLYGIPHENSWLRLLETVEEGSTEIQLDKIPLDWEVGDMIVIAPTGYDTSNTETAVIDSISGNTITLVSRLNNRHAVQPLLSSEAINHSNNVDWKTPGVIAPEVGLLSRNIIIQGGEDAEQSLSKYHFGCRIFSGEFLTSIESYPGHFELDSVEIRNCGQGGFFTSRDPRYSFAIKNGGENMRDSFITRSAIHHGYNTGIGIHVTNGIRIQDNVIYRTVGSGIRVSGRNNIIEDNLVILVSSVLPGDPKDKHAVDFPAGYEIEGFHTVKRNVAAGSYRLGFQVSGDSCQNTPLIENNLAHTTWTGMHITGIPANCTMVNSFTSIWAWNYGIFSQTVSSLYLSKIVVAVGKVGLNLNTRGPDPIQHLLGKKFISITDSLIIGALPDEMCEYTIPPYFLPNSFHPQGSKSGIMMPYMNKNPFKPFKRWHLATHYPVIDGDCLVSNVTFANFENRGCNFSDYSITNNPISPDAVTPITIRNSKMVLVGETSTMYFYPPDHKWVVQEDCVDMDCDGPKHALVKDIDGTFTSNDNILTTLIPLAEIRFDESKIPRTWRYDPVTELLLDPSVVAPPNLRGIARGYELDGIANNSDSPTRGCIYMESWNGYKCNNIDHYVLVIESMDTDTEVRRLSPIALNGGNIGNGDYTDLINGPMDHGWCTEYTCLKRLSTFFTVVASGTNYTIWLSSTAPSHIRFHLLNSDGVSSTDNPGSVLIKIWYKDTRRKDAYLDGKYVTPLNEDGNLYRAIGDQYIPTQNQQKGSNYYDYDSQTMYVLVKGSTPVSVITADVIQLSFSLSVSLEKFFDPAQFLNNLVAVLNIDPNTIRLVNVIAESRRKRQSDSVANLKVEIGDPSATEIYVAQTPSVEDQFESNEFNTIDAGVNDSVIETPTEAPPTLAPPPTYNNSDGATAPSARDFIEEYYNDVEMYNDNLMDYNGNLATYNELNSIANLLITLVQTNNFTIENATLTGLEVEIPDPPIPPPIPVIPPSYADIKSEDNETILTPVPEVPTETPLTSSCSYTQSCNSGIEILIPTELIITKHPAVVTGHLVNVILEVRDNEGSVVTQLGLTQPWRCVANLIYIDSEATPIISGQVVAEFVNGIAVFDRLRVDSPSEHLKLYFTTNPGNLVSDDTVEFEVRSPPSSWHRVTFMFRILLPIIFTYDQVVSDKGFADTLVYKLGTVMDVDLSRIQDIRFSEGSILVEGSLLEPFETDPPNVPTATEALDQLRAKINSNTFSFSYNGQTFAADQSSFSLGPTSTVAPPTLHYMVIILILIGCISVILLIIIIVIIVIGLRIAFVTRKKNNLIASREGILTNIYSSGNIENEERTEYQVAETIKDEGLIMMNPIYDFDSLPKVNTPATEEKFEYFAARSLDQEFCLPGTPLPPETDVD